MYQRARRPAISSFDRALLARPPLIGYPPAMPDAWLSRFHTVAFVEGLSYLALLGVAMPLKYLADMPLAVRVVGMAHGILFIAYVVLVALLLARRTRTAKWGLWALFLSVIPFGTFALTRERAQGHTT